MKIDVVHTAKLANLPLNDGQIKKFEKQLSSIIGYIEKLSEVPTEKVEETSQVTGLTNVLRKDEVSESLSQDEAISNTKKIHCGAFVVPATIDTEL